MYNTLSYVSEFGDLPYSSMPFSDGDNFALCCSLYMPVELVVTSDFEKEPKKTLRDSAKDLFEHFGFKVKSQGLLLGKAPFKNLLHTAAKKRFGDMKITGVRSVFDKDRVVQFCAMTLFVDDDTLFVYFRGTDDSIAGWQEDLDIYIKGTIPSYSLALDYLKDLHDAYPDKKIILSGHSKGANVALYAAINTQKEIRDKFIRVYNNDGPGFRDKSFINSSGYKEILPIYRFFVPSSSMVGVMLAHDRNYTVLSSTGIGPYVHAAETWGMIGNLPDDREELGLLGKVHEAVFEDLLPLFNDENTVNTFYKTLTDFLNAPGKTNLLELTEDIPQSLKKMIEAVKNESKQQKKVKATVFKSFAGSYAKNLASFGCEKANRLLDDAFKTVKKTVAAKAH